MDNFTQCAPQMEPILVPSVSTATSAQVPYSSVGPSLTYVPQSTLNNPMGSTVLPPPVSRDIASDQGGHRQQLKEADILRYIQAHLALVQAQERKNGNANGKFQDAEPILPKSFNPKEGELDKENSEGILSDEEEMDGVDMAPVRDTSCPSSDKKVFKLTKANLQKTAQKLSTVKHLLGELKALLTNHGKMGFPFRH